MIEVEIRAKVETLDEIKNKLNDLGAKFIKSEKQVDRVFGHPTFLDSQKKVIEGGFSSRLRQENNKVSLDFKEIVRKSGGIEIKTELKDVNTGLIFLKKLGWEEAFTISKIRDTYKHDGFEICLDNVDKLGNFIEVEKMVNSSGEIDKARKECLEFLESIYPQATIEDRKYGDLMQELIDNKVK